MAVIVILAVIALIVTPIVTGIIAQAKESADLRSAEGYAKAAENYYTQATLDETKKATLDGVTNVFNNLEVSGGNATSGNVKIDENDKVTMAIVLNNKCYTKSPTQNINEIDVSDDVENCVPKVPPYTEAILNGTDPVVSEGMIPVTIANDGTVTKADLYSDWYNYEEKRWANIILVNETSRSNYVSAEAGTAITSTDILAYFVWIPRYKYQLFNAAGTDSTTAQEIQIIFENKETTKSLGTTNEEWLTHPAFTFGSDELNGIWVGKFETTGSSTLPTILPGITSLRSQNISQEFTTSQLFNNTATYGINNDAHMAKNSEWGAAAYLTQSKYGRCIGGTCTEVSINNSSSYITGSSAGRPGDSTTYTSAVYAYNTSNGYLASTTGNITGIFDMSGGAWEYVMGYLFDSLGNSGFSTSTLPDAKYYQTYTANKNILGDAMLETQGWYGDYKSYVSSFYPWFKHGGGYSGSASAGVWAFYNDFGGASSYYSFRVVLAS